MRTLLLERTGTARFARGVTSGLAAGVVAGLPLLAAGPAAAATPEVSFSGGQGLLSCTSRPSDGSVTVTAESTVRFRNRLGETAVLRIDGRNRTQVGSGATADVLFHQGTVRVEMVPSCGLSLSNDFDAVSVRVVTPSSGPSSSAPQATPGTATPSPRDPTRGTSPSPAASATPSAATSAASASAAPSGSAFAPVDGGVVEPEEGTVGEAVAGGEEGLAEPVDPVAVEEGSSGLLAIIAIICVVGVSAGAIRAIVAQRASRTRAA